MRGDVAGYDTGKIADLAAADEGGSLTASEIAVILDTRELSVEVDPYVRTGD